MEEHDRELIALFRYGLIAPILQGNVSDRVEYLAEVSGKVYQVPYYGTMEYSPKTIQGWLNKYRKHGLEGLKPRRRSDKGRPRVISEEARQSILEMRQSKTHIPVTVFYEQLVSKGVLKPQEVSYSTLYRFLKKQDLVGIGQRKEPERKRFAYEEVNDMWQTDLAYGPYLRIGKKKITTYLFAFIDDASRLVPYAAFCMDQSFDSLRSVFKEALCRRGIPQRLFTDNGKIYRSQQFQFVCASLGIALIHARVYDAASKGKIERFFRTVRERFLSILEPEDLKSIDALNKAFWVWLETDYNTKVHSATGMSPLQYYMNRIDKVRIVTDPASIDPLFLRRESRKVKHDSTISIQKALFEVPPRYIGQRVEVRFEPNKLDEVLVYDEGAEVARVRPVNLLDNTKVKRQKPISLRLSHISQGKEA